LHDIISFPVKEIATDEKKQGNVERINVLF